VRTITSAGWWLRIFMVSLIFALIVPFINAGLNTWHNWAFNPNSYIIGIIYSFAIGITLNALAPVVWKRTYRTPFVMRWLARSGLIASGTALGCLVAGLPARALIGPEYHYWPSFRASYGIAIILSVLATVFSTSYDRFRSQLETTQLQLKEKEVEREKALKLATEATLSSLESRMHPHFLFNTINSISSLIQEDPACAEKMLSQMADLLRFSLDSARAGLVPLSSELKIVRDYLEIEKARFEDRLRYEIDIPLEFEELPFPPLSLQTLVENSLKYAVGVTRSGADIHIRARSQGRQIIIRVEDNGPGFSQAELPAGHGLNSLTSRLHSLYAGAAQLQIESQPGRTVVALYVPAPISV